MRDFLFLFINGRPVEVRGRHIFTTLSTFLRHERSAVGTKIVCEEGDCGACTVLIGRLKGGQVIYRPINSCIQQMHQLDATHVVTVEGLQPGGGLSCVQESMIRCHGAQCGFCTPGFITTLTGLFEENPSPSDAQVRDALTGNLCRCTGYEPIVKAAREVDPGAIRPLNTLYPPEKLLPEIERYANDPVKIETEGRALFIPVTIDDAVAFKSANSGTVVGQGATDVGVHCNKRGVVLETVLNVSKISELSRLELKDGVAEVGGSVTLFELESFFRELVPPFYEMLRLFGSPQIRYAGTLAGNIVNASPIADTLPFLYVMEAEVELTGPDGRRLVDIRSFYKGYRTLDMAPGEIVSSIRIPIPAPRETLRLYKISKRRDLDISSFTAAIRLTAAGDTIETIRIAYGGVGPTVLRLPKTEAALRGQPLSKESFARAGQIARGEITPIADVRGSREFRLQLAENILLKFCHECSGREVCV